jgi:hypothetical protein
MSTPCSPSSQVSRIFGTKSPLFCISKLLSCVFQLFLERHYTENAQAKIGIVISQTKLGSHDPDTIYGHLTTLAISDALGDITKTLSVWVWGRTCQLYTSSSLHFSVYFSWEPSKERHRHDPDTIYGHANKVRLFTLTICDIITQTISVGDGNINCTRRVHFLFYWAVINI